MRPRNEIILGVVLFIVGLITAGNHNRSSTVQDVGTVIVLAGIIYVIVGIVHAVRRRDR